MKTETKIKLFHEQLSCQDCFYNWFGYAHGFSRGHSLLRKNDYIIFIADDLVYSFLEEKYIDFEEPFKKYGWQPLESCPKCKSINLFPPQYKEQSVEEVMCLIAKANDFIFEHGKCKIINKILCSQNTVRF